MDNKPQAYLVNEAISVSRSSRAGIYRAIASGDLIARKRGSRTIILAADLEAWLNALPVIEPKSAA